MTTVLAEFDGKVFVPQEPVNLPVGARVAVSIPIACPPSSGRSFSPQEDQDWKDLLARIQQQEPVQPTVDDAMREIRMRP